MQVCNTFMHMTEIIDVVLQAATNGECFSSCRKRIDCDVEKMLFIWKRWFDYVFFHLNEKMHWDNGRVIKSIEERKTLNKKETIIFDMDRKI